MSKKYLYYFDEGSKAFNGDLTTMKNILGGKGAGLAEMTAAGMPVPRASPSPLRPAPSTTPMAARSTQRSRPTSSSTSRAWRRSPAKPSAM